MGFFRRISAALISLLIFVSFTYASNLENRVSSYFSGLADSIGNRVSNLLSENSRVKYLDLNLGVQENLKPTISFTNVNSIREYGNNFLFNQNSLSLHDEDQTINIGLGHRSLVNNDKVILGLNLFFDYSFDDAHQRNGAGIEVISSVFDLRSNLYDATSGIENVSSTTTEEALDGWDSRLDYHLPVQINARIFAGIFDFENAAGSFDIEGEKYGLNIISDRIDFEIGYVDDNRSGDGSFANLAYRLPLGNNMNNSNSSGQFLEYVSVAERVYEPVKRENKIRVLTTTLNIQASGF